MKRILCFIFVMLFIISNLILKNDIESELNELKNIVSITAIVNDSCDISGVHNGNKKLVKIKNLSQLNNIQYEGITLVFDFSCSNIIRYIDKYNIHIDNKYILDDIIVYDCYFKYLSTGVGTTLQIAIKNNYVVVGIPMILNDF